MKATKKNLKKVSLEKCNFALENLNLKSFDLFNKLPVILQEKIYSFGNKSCPLCSKYLTYYDSICNSECPFQLENGINCYNSKSIFFKWLISKTLKTRKKYAKLIIKVIENWEV